MKFLKVLFVLSISALLSACGNEKSDGAGASGGINQLNRVPVDMKVNTAQWTLTGNLNKTVNVSREDGDEVACGFSRNQKSLIITARRRSSQARARWAEQLAVVLPGNSSIEGSFTINGEDRDQRVVLTTFPEKGAWLPRYCNVDLVRVESDVQVFIDCSVVSNLAFPNGSGLRDGTSLKGVISCPLKSLQ